MTYPETLFIVLGGACVAVILGWLWLIYENNRFQRLSEQWRAEDSLRETSRRANAK